MKLPLPLLCAVIAIVHGVSGQSSNFSVFDKKKTPSPVGKVADDSGLPKPEIHLAFDELSAGTTPNTGKSQIKVTVAGCELVAGKIGKALDFSGEDCKVTLGPDFSKTISDTYTIAVWVFPHNQKQFGTIFNSKIFYGVNLRFQGDKIDLNTGGRWNLISSEAKAIPNAEWTHVAVTNDGSSAAIYVNGKLVGEKNTAARVSMDVTAELGQRVGAEADTGIAKPAEVLNASIDDLRVYTAVLTPEQIADLAKVPK